MSAQQWEKWLLQLNIFLQHQVRHSQVTIEMVITLPPNYPLGSISVKSEKRVGVSAQQWEKWLLQLNIFLQHQVRHSQVTIEMVITLPPNYPLGSISVMSEKRVGVSAQQREKMLLQLNIFLQHQVRHSQVTIEMVITLPPNYPLGSISVMSEKRVGVSAQQWEKMLLQLNIFLQHQVRHSQVTIEMVITLPPNYPLGSISVKSEKRVGVSAQQWEKWLLQLNIFLQHQVRHSQVTIEMVITLPPNYPLGSISVMSEKRVGVSAQQWEKMLLQLNIFLQHQVRHSQVTIEMVITLPPNYPLGSISVMSEKRVGVSAQQWEKWLLQLNIFLQHQVRHSQVTIEIVVTLPPNYPLGSISVKSEKRVGVSAQQWEKWLLQLNIFLQHQVRHSQVTIEIVVTLPPNYPLGSISVKSEKRVGVSAQQWEKWLLQLNIFLQHQVRHSQVTIEIVVTLPPNYPLGSISVKSEKRVGVSAQQWEKWLLQLNIFLQHQVRHSQVTIEMVITLPPNYPLGSISVKSEKRVGVSAQQWEKWLLQLNIFLQHQVRHSQVTIEMVITLPPNYPLGSISVKSEKRVGVSAQQWEDGFYSSIYSYNIS